MGILSGIFGRQTDDHAYHAALDSLYRLSASERAASGITMADFPRMARKMTRRG